MPREEDNSNDKPINNSVSFTEQKLKQQVKHKSYQAISGSFNQMNNQRKINVHRKQIEKMQNFDNETNHINPTTKNEYKIEKININRNDLLNKREQLLSDNPNLRTSLGHLEMQNDLTGSAALLNKQKNRNQQAMKKDIPHYKIREKHKQINPSNSKKQLEIIRSANGIELTNNGIKLDKNEDISLHSEGKPKKRLKSASITKPTDKYQLNKTNKINQSTKKQDNVKEKQRKRIRLGSPLSSTSIGNRTKTQKVVLAPSKAISGVGAGLKDTFNKDINDNEMTEGVQFANSVVSPIARKLRFETTSLISKKVGFDKKAYNLSKVEKQIMKTDKKAFKIKKAQRKSIRKRANQKARATILAQKNGSKGIIARGRAMASQSWKQIKEQMIKAVNAIIAKIATSKALIAGSSLLLIAIVPVVIFMPILMLGGGSAITGSEEEHSLSLSIGSLSPEVLEHEDTVVQELSKHGLEAYKDLVLVIIQLESGGVLPDVMQSSESLGLAPNSITDPQKSIEAGVNHLAKGIELMNKHNVDIQTLIQAYNYGNDFIQYVANKGGTWTQELSNSFSAVQASGLGWSSYGDSDYVTKAMQHLTVEGNKVTLNVSFDIEGGKLANPAPSAVITSPFGYRIHPITYERKLHGGTDFGAPFGTPIIASADGIVIEAGWKGGLGYAVVIDHGSGVQTVYGHNQKLLVTAGEIVKAGTQIAEMGSTGTSTGSHLHFEVHVNGTYQDPMNWLQ